MIADTGVIVGCFRLYVSWRFTRGVETQFNALQKGFNEIIPQTLLRPFDEQELEVSCSDVLLLLLFIGTRLLREHPLRIPL